MEFKKIIPFINAENEMNETVFQLSDFYAKHGADELYIYNYCKDEASREEFIHLVQRIAEGSDLPIVIGLYVKRFEDVKKALYTGAHKVVIKYSILDYPNVIKEATSRFGNDKIMLELDDFHQALDSSFVRWSKDAGIYGYLLKHLTLTESLVEMVSGIPMPILIRDSLTRNDLSELLAMEPVVGVASDHFEHSDLLKIKQGLKSQGIAVNTYASAISFDQFKLNGDGLIPVVTQDYKTNEVLMLAYMNQQAFEETIRSGKMTYYSRSRQELWKKGETSGHYQCVKSLTIDCDNDTILAKVEQIGAACHTGNRTCFFTDLVKKEYEENNTQTILDDVFAVIMDRKRNPKEGSYTNYLFDHGIDKILKKCGEEATEIVIAAKNPDAAELKYEISDFLYHMMVLMADRGLDWNDIMKELAHRK